MSRWLKSVNSILEKLDGTVETAIEEQAILAEEENGLVPGEGKDAIESILAKRGLSFPTDDDDEEEFSREDQIVKTTMAANPTTIEESNDTETKQPAETEDNDDDDDDGDFMQDIDMEKSEIVEGDVEQQVTNTNEEVTDDEPKATGEQTKETPRPAPQVQGSNTEESGENKDEVHSTPSKEMPADTGILPTVQQNQGTAVPKLATSGDQTAPQQQLYLNPEHEMEYQTALSDAREAHKQTRMLRRHVVALNNELETAEAEIKAQRSELERAGERLEKDRKRYKEEKEKMQGRHTDEVKILKKRHEEALSDLRSRSDQQLEDARKRLRDVEEKRMQEGGDWTMELEEAVHREQGALRKLALLDDEKSTLLAQIATLQSQQERLENRLDSISQTADNALSREREAEDKLDMTLSMHARQLSQRQSREAELERTISDLGAALAATQKRETLPTDNNLEPDHSAMTMKEQLVNMEEELETTKARLETERQRAHLMQRELRDISKERAEEATTTRSRQLQFDRQIAEMSLTISRLQSSLREAQRGSFSEGENGSRAEDENKTKQVQELSEQLLRQQERLGQSTSEVSALRSRLQAALNRAQQAEDALASSSYDVESAPSSGNLVEGMRRRGGKRKQGGEFDGSIRSAIRLHDSGENTERIGKAIDAVDKFSVDAGKYLRRNPLARGGFILYLLLLHLWTFAILFFQTHGYETLHPDFGAGRHVGHGPHALMQQGPPLEIPASPVASKDTQPKNTPGVVSDGQDIDESPKVSSDEHEKS